MTGRKHSARPRGQRPRAGAPGAAGTDAAWLYGLHAVRAALANPRRQCLRLLATPDGRAALGVPSGPAEEIVSRHELDALLPRAAVHQGVALLVTPLPPPSLSTACGPRPRPGDVVIALDRVSDPRNVGAIVRSAAAFEARAVLLTERHAPAETGALAKAASGALEVIPVVRVVNLARAVEELKAMGYWAVGLAAEAEATLAGVAPEAPVALVLGAEGGGLRRLVADRCDVIARLPTSRAMPSLNVSSAAAIALYELRGRRRPAEA